jgi:hypothetical protein
MLLLTSTSDLITVITDAASDIEVQTAWVDKIAGSEPTTGRLNTASITTATTTTIVASPAGSTARNVKHMSFHNNHATVSCLLRISHTDGTTVSEMIHSTLLPGEALTFDQNGKWTHFDNNGVDYAFIIAYTDQNFGIAGNIAETIPRNICTEANVTALNSGILLLTAVFLRAGQVVTNISFFSATTAAGTPTNGFFCLYNSLSKSLLASSANFTSEAWAANSIKTKAMTTPYTILKSGIYYLGIMITATTVPTLKGLSITAGGLALELLAISGTSTTGLTTTLPNPCVIPAAFSVKPWACVT